MKTKKIKKGLFVVYELLLRTGTSLLVCSQLLRSQPGSWCPALDLVPHCPASRGAQLLLTFLFLFCVNKPCSVYQVEEQRIERDRDFWMQRFRKKKKKQMGKPSSPSAQGHVVWVCVLVLAAAGGWAELCCTWLRASFWSRICLEDWKWLWVLLKLDFFSSAEIAMLWECRNYFKKYIVILIQVIQTTQIQVSPYIKWLKLCIMIHQIKIPALHVAWNSQALIKRKQTNK